ncbi:hypothetical protein MSG28_001892, partial [Choristoneura fumiferana]
MLIYKLQIMGLSKVRRNGFGELRTPRGLTFLYSGKQDEEYVPPNGAHHCSMCANAVARISTVTTTYLVVAEVRLKVALARAASATTKIGKRFEVNKLRDPDVGAAFGLELRNRFSGLEMDSSTSVHAEWNYILLVWNLVESGR